jgi:thymidylate synthase
MTKINYLLYEERTPDLQYTDLLRFIRQSPETHLMKHPYQTNGRFSNPCTPRMTFKFENGFPILTERKIPFWKKSITEIILFMKGVHTLEEMVAAGCGWWADWVVPEKCADFGLEPGDLGPGSYGPVLANLLYVKPFEPSSADPGIGYPLETFNQIKHLVQSLKDGPALNGHVITTWFPPLAMQHSKLKRQVVVAPCHGTKIQCTVREGKKLILTMTQRSGDVPIGVVTNIIQYAALCIMLAHVCGYEPYMYTHVIDDAQIYEDQVKFVDELLETEKVSGVDRLKRMPYPFPTLLLTKDGQRVDNIFDFTADHFELWDYQSHPAMKIPTTL